MNEPLFGCEVLDKAFLEAAESQAADLADLLTPSDQEEEHVFSPRYQQEMARMLAQQRGGKKKHLLRAASVLLAVCLGLGVTVTQVEAVRQPLAQYFMKMTSEYTSITFEGDVGAQGIPFPTSRRRSGSCRQPLKERMGPWSITAVCLPEAALPLTRRIASFTRLRSAPVRPMCPSSKPSTTY